MRIYYIFKRGYIKNQQEKGKDLFCTAQICQETLTGCGLDGGGGIPLELPGPGGLAGRGGGASVDVG